MKYFLFLLCLAFATFSNADCPPEIHGVFTSTLSDPPYTICANHSNFGSDKCVMEIYNMEKSGNEWSLYGKTTGSTCNQVTQLHPDPDQYECKTTACPADQNTKCPEGYSKGYYQGNLACVKDEEDPRGTLQCNQDYCYNPDNLRCPSGYTGGSMNGLAICAKSGREEEEPPESPDCIDDPDCKVVHAVNVASDRITGAIDNQSNTIWDAVNNFWENLRSYLDEKLGSIEGGNGSGNGGSNPSDGGSDGGEIGDVDTSPLDGELPYFEIDGQDKRLSQNVFNHSAQCPANNELSLNFMGKNYSYTFKYAEICDGARIIGYLILMAAYLYAAIIVIKV